jgi:hypothetical protein
MKCKGKLCTVFIIEYLILPVALGPGVYSASNRNIKIIMFLGSKVWLVREADNLTAIYEPNV